MKHSSEALPIGRPHLSPTEQLVELTYRILNLGPPNLDAPLQPQPPPLEQLVELTHVI